MKKHILLASLVSILLLPVVTFAALDGVKGLLTEATKIINLAIPAVAGLSMLYFFWGVGQFILHAGDAKTRDEGRNKMLWGVIALFVIFSIMGILKFLGDATGIKSNGSNGSGGSSQTGAGCTDYEKATEVC